MLQQQLEGNQSQLEDAHEWYANDQSEQLDGAYERIAELKKDRNVLALWELSSRRLLNSSTTMSGYEYSSQLCTMVDELDDDAPLSRCV